MRLEAGRVLALALGKGLLIFVGFSAPPSNAQCTCADAGSSLVYTSDYDTEFPSGLITEDELQCAIDCLDGDPDDDSTVATTSPSDAPQGGQTACQVNPAWCNCWERDPGTGACTLWGEMRPDEDDDGDPPTPPTCESDPNLTCRPWRFTLADQPNCVPAATLVFDPSLPVVLGKPVALPGCSTGPLIFRGNGVPIYVLPGRPGMVGTAPTGRFAAFHRLVPEATVCSQFVAGFGSGAEHWVFEDLHFRLGFPGPPLGDRPPDTLFKGIEAHALYWPSFRRCSFGPMSAAAWGDLSVILPGGPSPDEMGFDVGIELRRGTWAVIERCQFVHSRLHDVALLSREVCLDGSTEDCWLPDGVNDEWRDDTGCFIDGNSHANGSLHVTLADTLHEVHPTQPDHDVQGGLNLEAAIRGGPINIVAHQADSVVIERATLRGGRPLAFLARRQTSADIPITLRDLRIDLRPGSEELELPIFWDDSGAGVKIEAVTLSIPGPNQLLHEATGLGQFGAPLLIRDVVGFTENLRLKAPDSSLPSFVNVDSEESLAHQQHWLGGRPTNVMVRDSSRFTPLTPTVQRPEFAAHVWVGAYEEASTGLPDTKLHWCCPPEWHDPIRLALEAHYCLDSAGLEGESPADQDADGIPDCDDTCVATSDPTNQDTDGDSQGDVCDDDDDGDGVLDPDDNCLRVANVGQGDADGDGVGDACDPDWDGDGDGLVAETDNCADIANPGQENADGDPHGDACDNCPLQANTGQHDCDDDGVGDICDNCPNRSNPGQENADGDPCGDVCDNEPGDGSRGC